MNGVTTTLLGLLITPYEMKLIKLKINSRNQYNNVFKTRKYVYPYKILQTKGSNFSINVLTSDQVHSLKIPK